MAANEGKPEEIDLIVVGKRNDDMRAVWDRHQYHPSNYGQPAGEVFISDMRPYEVHRSRGIQQKLGERELQEINERAQRERTAAHEEKEDQRNQLREELLASRNEAAVTIPGTTAVPVYQAPSPQPPLTGTAGASAHPETAVTNDERPPMTTDAGPAVDEEDEEANPASGVRVRRPRQPGGATPDR